MELSLIWILSEDDTQNQTTLEYLQKELSEHQVQLLMYATGQSLVQKTCFGTNVTVESYENPAFECEGEVLAHAAKRVQNKYVTQLHGGDVWSVGALQQVAQSFSEQPDISVVSLRKVIWEEEIGSFCTVSTEKEIDLTKQYDCVPFYLDGTFVDANLFRQHNFKAQLRWDAQREFLLTILAKTMRFWYLSDVCYESANAQEGNNQEFFAVFDEQWYEQSYREFWIPFLEQMQKTYTQVPVFIQYQYMFGVRIRLLQNLNNKNKHVIPEGQEEACLRLMGGGFQYIEDGVLMNDRAYAVTAVPDSMKWIYGILKYGPEFVFDCYRINGKTHYGYKKTVFDRICNLKTTVAFINPIDGRLEIDGLVHPILFAMAKEVYFGVGEKRYHFTYNERYAHTKAYGVSLYKSHSFHLSIPIEELIGKQLFCYAEIDGVPEQIYFTYDSHFSRISGRFKNNYWVFKDAGRSIMLEKVEGGWSFAEVSKGAIFKKELRLQKEMLGKKRKKECIFILIRNAYFFTKLFKKKKIWMYLDKIYKGGDSSEYLYRYASEQKDSSIKHYYLIDKTTPDYKRLKKDGFRPLVRGSIKHRLVFLLSDMMVISNSTVFAFNDFGMVNSSYVRDLVDFHVCCVQHGMSVQKIAVAQNRLRDNTRLYFCASKYEIENLSRPIYDYVGYDALKLTGVPRYDGLVNDDKKQIMISPTWRMQAAVQVKTNEGRQRDYNPLFKESTYYKVFNALINDERLIEAAKTYGYRIKYVLHPIVSSQVDDFDKNEYVDIIPAAGDMSYEKMFCESSLMVTDFSGIQFDFAYMRKPLVYLHHKDIPQHYEEGTFFYDTMAFGEICHDNDELIDMLCSYMKEGCQMKPEYVKRADDFFYYRDHKNCERIYQEMINYQEKYVK